MKSVQKYFKEKKDDLYSRCRLAQAPKEKQRVIRDRQKFNTDTRKYRGVIPPITATSMEQTIQQKPEKPIMGFRRIMEADLQ